MLQITSRGACFAAVVGALWAVATSVEPVAAHGVAAHSTPQTAETVVALLPLIGAAVGIAWWRARRGRDRG